MLVHYSRRELSLTPHLLRLSFPLLQGFYLYLLAFFAYPVRSRIKLYLRVVVLCLASFLLSSLVLGKGLLFSLFVLGPISRINGVVVDG